MSKGKELAKNTIIIILGKVCTQFISFFLIPLYTSYLNTTDYGNVDLINTYITLLVPIVTLQLEQAIFRFLIDARNDEERKKIIISNTFKKLFLHSIIYIIIMLIVNNFLNIDYKYYLISNVIVFMLSSVCLQIARGLGKTKIYSYGSVVTGTVSVVLNVILIAIVKMNASGILISNLMANSICFIFLFCILRLDKYLKFSRKQDCSVVKEMYKYSLPLIPNSISWWVVNTSDRTIISIMLGLSYNGIYSISHKFSNIYILMYNLFNLSWTESVSLHINDNDSKEYLTKTINKLFVLFSTICIMIISVLPLVFDVFVKGEYAVSYNYMPILLLASLFNMVVGLYSAIYVAKKETKELAKSSVLVAIINIVVNLLLISKIGLYAAALSTLIAYFVMMIIRYTDVKKYINIKLKLKNILYIIIGVVMAIGAYYSKKLDIIVVNLILVTLFAMLINKEFLGDIAKILKDIWRKYKNEN